MCVYGDLKLHIILYLATGEWTTPSTSGTPPTPRQGHIAAVVGNRMFVHGGMSGQQISNDLHVLNLSKSALGVVNGSSCTQDLSTECHAHLKISRLQLNGCGLTQN